MNARALQAIKLNQSFFSPQIAFLVSIFTQKLAWLKIFSCVYVQLFGRLNSLTK